MSGVLTAVSIKQILGWAPNHSDKTLHVFADDLKSFGELAELSGMLDCWIGANGALHLGTGYGQDPATLAVGFQRAVDRARKARGTSYGLWELADLEVYAVMTVGRSSHIPSALGPPTIYTMVLTFTPKTWRWRVMSPTGQTEGLWRWLMTELRRNE